MAELDETEDEREFCAQYSETPICVYRALKERARRKDDYLIEYGELNQCCQLGLDLGTDHGRTLIGNYVGAVSEFEVSKGRPMLSAVVVHKQKPRTPGNGFYDWADELKQRRPGESNNALWIRILNECIAYWGQQP